MGKTFSTGLLTNGIWQDASNNIGIGAAPSGSYKLEVTGTAKVSTSAYFAIASGSVGIGTASPSDKFSVDAGTGNIVTSSFFNSTMTAGQSTFLEFGKNYSNNYNTGELAFKFVGDGSSSNMVSIGFYGAGNKLNVLGNGNVGIGETSLGNEKLTIKQTTGNASALYVLTSGVTAGQSYGLTVVAGTNSSDRTFAVFNQSSTEYFRVRGDGAITTGTASQSPYNLTTGNSANCYIENNGFLYRSTSSLKYKTDVKDYTKGLNEVLQLRPVFYKGKGENDGDKQYAGLIEEEVHDLGLTEFVQYAEDGTPDALAYANMIALLTKAIQEQQATITSLQERLNKAGL